jgi:integrase
MLATLGNAALSTELAEAIDQARTLREASKAKATRAAYASDLRDFAAYCARLGVSALPADPAVIGTYLATMAQTKSVATIRRRMVAIAQAHKTAGLPNPVAHPEIRETLQGIARTKTVAQHKKAALTLDRLEEVVKAIAPGLKGQRDRALLLLMFACASRRSEVVALDVSDLSFDSYGLTVTLRKSKTDQTGKGRKIGVPYVANSRLCAATNVRRWLDAAGIVSGPVFTTFDGAGKPKGNRIDGKDIARLIKRLTGKAHVDGDFSGHSLRSGFITTGVRKKVSETSLRRVSGHKSACFRGYVEDANVFEDNALTAILGQA